MILSMIHSKRLLFSLIMIFTFIGMIFEPCSLIGIEIENSESELTEITNEAQLEQEEKKGSYEWQTEQSGRNDIRPAANVPPTASIWCPVSASTVFPVLMDASNSTDSDGSIEEYWWSFGDGSEYIESSLVALDGAFDGITYHEYTDDGHYNVTLNITDDNSSISSVSTSIDIMNRPPVPQFTAPDTLFSREPLYLDGS